MNQNQIEFEMDPDPSNLIKYVFDHKLTKYVLDEFYFAIYAYEHTCAKLENEKKDELMSETQKLCEILVKKTIRLNELIVFIKETISEINDTSERFLQILTIQKMILKVLNVCLPYVSLDQIYIALVTEFYKQADENTFHLLIELLKIIVSVKPLSMFKHLLSQDTDVIAKKNPKILISYYKRKIFDMVDDEGNSLLYCARKYNYKSEIIEYLIWYKYVSITQSNE